MKKMQQLVWALAWLPLMADAKTQMVDVALNGAGVSQAVNIVLALTLVALLPGMMVAMTSFTRIVIVLSMLRHAMGMQETPPNVVLIMLAAFLTLLSMGPTFEKLDQQVVTPLYQQRLPASTALRQGGVIMKEYMIGRTREQDMSFVLSSAGKDMPDNAESISLVHVVPAFLLSELRLAFQIGFVIFLPFLLVDIIVSSILMAMGMMMVPPVSIALPIKVLMFVLIDGWTLVARAVLSGGT